MIEVAILGPLRLVHADRSPEAVEDLSSPTQRLVLALLAAARGKTMSRDRLVEAVWDTDVPRTATKSLMTYVARLRNRLGSEALPTQSSGYALLAGTDADRFERLLQESRDAVAVYDRIDALRSALALWRGPAFGELAEYPEIAPEAERLDELRLQARSELGEALLGADDPALAVAELRALVGEHPLHEPGWILLVRALACARRTADALRAAAACRRHLAEVGLEPSSGLQAAEHLALGSGSRDGAADRTAAVSVPGNLPHLVSRFVGRRDEVERLVELFACERIITLLGPGGVGKTRLAIESARAAARHFPGGAWLCDLRGVGGAADVATTVARVLGVRLVQPLMERITDFARHRVALLVLDNAESAAEGVAEVCERIVRACPGLVVMVTSRERLGVDGEHVCSVRPLAPAEAVELFEDRAVAIAGPLEGREQITRICRSLDHLPLAIEMAAARARLTSLEALADRLEHAPTQLASPRRTQDPSHRTLRDVVAWSYDLLGPSERRAFVRLSVPAGGFDADAAASVMGSDPAESADPEALLGALVDKSLLVADHSDGAVRFHMLDTIADFARDELDGADGDEAVLGHIDHYVDVAGAIGSGLSGADEAHWAVVAEAETPNLELAHRRAVRTGAVEAAVQIPALLFDLVYHRLRADIAGWARETMDLTGSDRHRLSTTMGAVAALGALQAGHLQEADTLATAAAAMAHDSHHAPHAWLVRAAAALYAGRLPAAARYAESAAYGGDATGDVSVRATGLVLGSLALGYGGDLEAAAELAETHRRLADHHENPTQVAYAHYLRGELFEPDPAGALDALATALELASRVGAALGEGVALVSITTLTARHGSADAGADTERAIALFHDSIEHWQTRSDWTHQLPTLRHLAVFLTRLGRLEDAALLLGAIEGEGRASFGAEADLVTEARTTIAGGLSDRTREEIRRRTEDVSRDELLSFALGVTTPSS